MTPFATAFTDLLSVGTIILNIITIIFVVIIIFVPNKTKSPIQKISSHVLLISFLAAFLAAAGSIIYSNVIGYAPCELCWWDRIFMYPQAVIFAVTLYYKYKYKTENREVWLKTQRVTLTSGFALSLIGGAISLYQYYGQSFNPDILPACAATGVSCAKLYFVSFGYVTLPFMSLSVFVFLISLFCIYKLFPIE